MTELKRTILILLSIGLLGFGVFLVLFGEEDPKESEFVFLYAINTEKVKTFGDIPYLYTHLSLGEGDEVLYFPEIVDSYLYSDSTGLSWMPQKEKTLFLTKEYYSKITEQDTLRIFRKRRNFWDDVIPDEIYIENSEGKKIPLIPDTYGVESSKGLVRDMKSLVRDVEKTIDGVQEIKDKRGLEKMKSDFEKNLK